MQYYGPLVLTQFQIGNEKGMRLLTFIDLICLEVQTIREHNLETSSPSDQELDLDPWFMIICDTVHNQFVQIKNLSDLIVYDILVLFFLINVIFYLSGPFSKQIFSFFIHLIFDLFCCHRDRRFQELGNVGKLILLLRDRCYDLALFLAHQIDIYASPLYLLLVKL